jgi:hypothetical protein
MNIDVRRPKDDEYGAIVALQDKYVAANLDEKAKAGGFLSARFSPEQFRKVDERLRLIVGAEGNSIVAFLCSWLLEDCREQPIVSAMLAAEGMDTYALKACVAGPVCIDESQRGKGLLKLLYDKLASELTGRYVRMLIFVDVTNAGSIRAHEKIGFKTVVEFSRSEKQYVGMAKDV